MGAGSDSQAKRMSTSGTPSPVRRKGLAGDRDRERERDRLIFVVSVVVACLPVVIPGYPVRPMWHERMQRDPGHVWLRSLIATLFKST